MMVNLDCQLDWIERYVGVVKYTSVCAHEEISRQDYFIRALNYQIV
jgi:hypothetical protein